MINIWFMIYLLVAHLVGDFVLQDDATAKRKSSDNTVLLTHCISYVIPLSFIAIVVPIIPVCIFIVTNIILHFITDYTSSRLTSYYWKKDDRHKFFLVIGIDQTIHYITLILTTYYILPRG